MRKFWSVLIALQVVCCALVLLMFGPELASSTRNPEAGLAALLVGLPLVIGQIVILAILFLFRDGLPEAHRDKILMSSTVMMIAAPLVLLFAMRGS